MRVAALLLAVLVTIPATVSGWGFEAHKFIADRMIGLLPPELKPLFEKRRAYVVERAIDPDLWRTVGWEQEPPNHFLDLDHEAFGPYPFDGLPRDYAAAVQKFGKDFMHEQGLLPWRVQEFYGMLQREFESLKRKPAPGYASDNIVLYSAILAHYVADGHVPLHAVVNYNGQLTGQEGLHSRWESELFERNRTRLKVAPAPPKGVATPRDFMFDALLASNRHAASVLESDQKAAAGREFYDDAYFEALAAGTLPVLERRLNDSITAVASVIIGAWEQAGRPAVPTDSPRTPRRIRRPNQ
ncbi:MAG: hypothetical protein A3J29_11575 [Acidobacteria bacterium RIFCSPLOWO2_12_FULL_67_14b]|nr:MAG: hypothetical protein A3J29_11575 [Acidobacteria bacterium RIFCSPLOWO2_12_FULL_67_14b]